MISIEERRNNFILEIRIFSGNYSSELLNSFYKYWTQVDQVSGLMRFEKQKTFFIKKRLFTFKKNSERFKKKNTVENYLKTANELIAEAKAANGSGA
jgi:hypothetical protein